MGGAHDWGEIAGRIRSGGPARGHAKLVSQNKMFVRDRIARLVDEGSFVEDGFYANALAEGLSADGVVCGTGRISGRVVAIMANDPTVKAGSWGARTVEKIIRITEVAYRDEIPIFYLIDSAGARITDQVDLFPGRRGAGKIFHNQVRLSGRVPQICCLFGPSAAGGAYIPAFCDVVIMVDANASMYLGSPRMAQMVVGEDTTLEAMGGARVHTADSGSGDFLATSDEEAIETAKDFLSYLPQNWQLRPNRVEPADTLRAPSDIASIVPSDDKAAYDIRDVIDSVVDGGSFLEIKERWAAELVIGFARIDGEAVGIVANQPCVKGGVLFIDSADKAARFIWLCDAFNLPLVFLADVPGFMIGSVVERQGIIRHGAKMITAVAEATVPKICVVVRKAFGAGLYAMAGPGFEPIATLALPTAEIAVMGPEAAVNAVFFNQIQALPEDERDAFVAVKRAEYAEDVDLLRLASENVIDAVVEPADLRAQLIARFGAAAWKGREFSGRRHGVPPV